MSAHLNKYWINYLLVAAGLAGGFLYWRLVGCNSGSCPITAHWHSSVLTGGIMGYLAGDMVADFRKKNKRS
jgi:hypothetical protein